MKRIIAIMLAAVIAASISVTAFAAWGGATSTDLKAVNAGDKDIVDLINWASGGEGVAWNRPRPDHGDNQDSRIDGLNGPRNESTSNGFSDGQLSHTVPGAWLKYDLNVATAGTYSVKLRGVFDHQDGPHIVHLKSDPNSDATLTTFSLPGRTGWQAGGAAFTDGDRNVSLGAGANVIYIYFDNDGNNCDLLEFTLVSAGAVSAPAASAATGKDSGQPSPPTSGSYAVIVFGFVLLVSAAGLFVLRRRTN
jgi:hypothetical protein